MLGPCIQSLLYILFRSPHNIQTCSVSAFLSDALPLNRTCASNILQSASPTDTMHCLRSLLVSTFCFFLFGFNTDAQGVGPGQALNSSISTSIYNTRFENVTWDNAAWEVRTTNLDQGHYQSRLSIANGYLGINVAAVGPFFEVDTPVDDDNINGWPLFSTRQTFATIAGFFDEQATTNGTNFPWLNQYGGESVISGIPHWGGIVVDLGAGVYLDATVDNTTISNFSSTLNAKRVSRPGHTPDSRKFEHFLRYNLHHVRA